MLPEGIQRIPMRRWENKHQNFKQKLNKKASFKIQNPDSVAKSADRYRASTKNFQWLIQHAQANNLKVRALGSGWSFSKVGVTDGGIIDTKSLSLTFTVSEDHINDQYVGQKEDLLFCQCGIAIETLNVILEEKLDPKRSLKASGASNGQSIVGAMSTGTHGSAFDVGSLQDFVVGLHLVVGANRHVYIERASYPVVNDGFKNWLGDDTEWIRDDTVFNAALVCFGSFGFIHGVMIETEPIYLLQEERGIVQYDEALRECIDTLNFDLIEDKLAFPANNPDKQLYHFEMVVNPHRFQIGASDNEVFLKTLYKKPYKPGYHKRPAPDAKYTYGDDLLGLIQSVLDAMPRLSHHYIPSLVNMLFPLAFTDKIEGEGTVGETFTYTKFRGKVASAALGIDIKDASRLLEEILKINDDQSFAGGLSFRFVKGTDALLGFTCFPQTCVLELDGVDSKVTRKFYQKLWDHLESQGIKYTLHWGKINFNLDKEKIRWMYGDERVDQWISVRNYLLAPETREVFSNEFTERCGLLENITPYEYEPTIS